MKLFHGKEDCFFVVSCSTLQLHMAAMRHSVHAENDFRPWENDKEEIFGERWPEVTQVLAALRAYGIHLLDINPANITFGERSG